MPTVSTQEAAFTGIILFYVAFTDVFNYHKVVDGVFADCSIVAVEVDRIVIFLLWLLIRLRDKKIKDDTNVS